ncbi:MAG: hypothetical protein QM706_20040 [Nitrospira sp.]
MHGLRRTARCDEATADDIRSLLFLEKAAIADNLTLDAQHTQQFTYSLFEPPQSDFTGSAAGVGVFLRETDTDGILRDARLVYPSKVEYPPSTTPLRGKQPVSNLADGAPVALPNLALMSALRVFDQDKGMVRVDAGEFRPSFGYTSPRPSTSPSMSRGACASATRVRPAPTRASHSGTSFSGKAPVRR